MIGRFLLRQRNRDEEYASVGFDQCRWKNQRACGVSFIPQYDYHKESEAAIA